MSNLALGWIGYYLLGVLHSSALPHNLATSNGRVEEVLIAQGIELVVG
jgi:hypothetical protein